MNLFRSEEHAKGWGGNREETYPGILSLAQLMTIFSAPLFSRRLDTDYITRLREHVQVFVETMARVTNNSPYWKRDF